MSDKGQSKIDAISEKIHQLRDELEVQLNLGASEAREEWEKLEPKLDAFKAQMEQVGGAAEDAVEGVADAASLAGGELVSAYERIKSILSR